MQCKRALRSQCGSGGASAATVRSRRGCGASSSMRPAARVRAALALLPERQRLALFLRYYADLDYRTISETLCIAVGTVGVTLSNAQAKLRRLLEEVAR
jgi:DNA-directed RNA polymerase specialized sigma24 family protein